MKFDRIKISESISKAKGIAEIDLRRLSSVIALVGKNGSGKSRILDLIEENLFSSITITGILDNSIKYLPAPLQNIVSELQPLKDYFQLLEEYEVANQKMKLNSSVILQSEVRVLHKKLQSNQNHLANQNHVRGLRQHFNQTATVLKNHYLRRIRHNEIQQLQQAIGEKKDGQMLFESLIENVSLDTNYDELKSIHSSSLKFLSKLPHQLAFDKYDCIANDQPFEERISSKRFRSLKKFIKDFLNKELSWEQRIVPGNLTESGNNVTFAGVWKLNGRLFNYAEFSDGEKTLFAYALLFFLLDQNPKLNIKESIILIDEPELHLHPDSEIDLIEGIRNAIGEKGQLIIATHSINILSTLNYEEIFMVKDGIITHPSRVTPSKSLSELMCIEQRIEKLSDFLSSMSTWALVNFMGQCFSKPEVIESSRTGDPQIEELKKIIKGIASHTNVLLDFGAGKGRLLEQLNEDYEFMAKLSYSALEPEVTFHQRLQALGSKNIFTSYTQLPLKTFDFILLCNVLHEIPLDEWEASLNSVISSLKDNGFLIIMEANALSKGEKIGEIGYLMMGLDELRLLFNLDKLPSSLKIDGNKNSIVCAVINKSELRNISRTEILNAIELLEASTLEKIGEIRKNNYEATEQYRIGREIAFLSQQHINAKFASRYLKSQVQLNG